MGFVLRGAESRRLVVYHPDVRVPFRFEIRAVRGAGRFECVESGDCEKTGIIPLRSSLRTGRYIVRLTDKRDGSRSDHEAIVAPLAAISTGGTATLVESAAVGTALFTNHHVCRSAEQARAQTASFGPHTVILRPDLLFMTFPDIDITAVAVSREDVSMLLAAGVAPARFCVYPCGEEDELFLSHLPHYARHAAQTRIHLRGGSEGDIMSYKYREGHLPTSGGSSGGAVFGIDFSPYSDRTEFMVQGIHRGWEEGVYAGAIQRAVGRLVQASRFEARGPHQTAW